MSQPALSIVRDSKAAGLLLDPQRRQLVESLAAPDSAAGLARRLGLPRQRVNYHLRLLEREGLVEEVEQRRKGNCVERLVRATARAFVISPDSVDALGGTPGPTLDRASVAALVGSAARTIREVAALEARASQAKKRLATATLDGEIRFRGAADRAAFLEELVAGIGRLTAKYHDDRVPGGRRFRVVTLVHPRLDEDPQHDR